MTGKAEATDSVVAVLAGGGIDSTLCMHLLRNEGKSLRALHVDFGQAAHELEWKAVVQITSLLEIPAEQIRVKGGEISQGEVPGRNAFLIFLALTRLLPSEKLICIGIHAGTPFYDCSKSFFESTAKLVAEYTDSRVRLIAPLLRYTKPEIVSLARSIGLRLELTHSCQRAIDGGCGVCHSCKDRKVLAC